jgi:hypothetical protein
VLPDELHWLMHRVPAQLLGHPEVIAKALINRLNIQVNISTQSYRPRFFSLLKRDTRPFSFVLRKTKICSTSAPRFGLRNNLIFIFGGNMKTKVILTSLLFCLCAAALCFAAADGFLGTWKLNEAKSKIAAGTAKNSTVVYEASGDSIKITIDGTGVDGKPSHIEWTGKYDGKDYPVTGAPTYDTFAVTQVDDHTLHIAAKKGGKNTLTAHIVLSADGKTRTVTTTGTDAKGAKVRSIAVYDKQ